MKEILILIIVTIISFEVIAADNYVVGQKLYVWAKNGLNLREGTSTTYPINQKLLFAEEIIVLEKREEIYKVKAINHPNQPIILKGNWVKIKSKNGIIGYVIDQYLLSLKPNSSPTNRKLNLQLIKVDSIQQIPEHKSLDGKDKIGILKKNYDGGIVEEEEISGGMWTSSKYTFPNFTIEEVLIIFSSSWNNYKELEVLTNWKNKVDITDKETCTIKLKFEKNKVIAEIFCASC